MEIALGKWIGKILKAQDFILEGNVNTQIGHCKWWTINARGEEGIKRVSGE